MLFKSLVLTFDIMVILSGWLRPEGQTLKLQQVRGVVKRICQSNGPCDCLAIKIIKTDSVSVSGQCLFFSLS